MSKIAFILVFLFATLNSYAAKYSMGRGSSEYSSSRSYGSSSAGGHMTMDISALYVRDTKPDGLNDSAGKVSLGGMFTSVIGLDFVGMLASKSKDYMVGADLKIMPTDWFFLKGGYGAYAEKTTKTFKATPIIGTGIMANLGDGYYLTSEFMYFEKADRKNVGIGAGLGISF